MTKLRQLGSHSPARSLADAGEHGGARAPAPRTIFALFRRSTNQRSRMTHTGQKGCIQEERSGRSKSSQNRDSGSKQQREQGCGECRRGRRRHEIYCTVPYSTVETVSKGEVTCKPSTVLLRKICVAYSVFFVSRWWESRIRSPCRCIWWQLHLFWSALIETRRERRDAFSRGVGRRAADPGPAVSSAARLAWRC